MALNADALGSTEWRTARGELGTTPIVVNDSQTVRLFDSSANPTCLVYNGSARLTQTGILLTPSASDQAGSVFFQTPIDVSPGFRLRFKFQVSAGEGADGLAVVFQAQGPSSLGEGKWL